MKQLNYNRKKGLEKYYSDPKHCKFCNKIIEVKDTEKIQDVKRKKFCSHSCSASFSNKSKITYVLEDLICECGNKKHKHSNKCRECYNNDYNNKTLFDILKDGKYSTIKLNSVRRRARLILKNSDNIEQCIFCKNNEFKKVLEACHIKDIMEFDLNTKVKIINSIDNLIWLCPSHHKMFDKGLITIK